MYHNLIKILVVLVFIPIISFAGGSSLSLDNDVFSHTDRAYTHGTKLTYWNENIPPCLDNFFKGREKRVTYALGQYMYSPTNITIPQLIEEDRPYGGWLYFGYSFQASTARRHDFFEVDIGVTGDASLAGETQKFIHELIDSKEPMGWGNQLGDEVGVNLIWQEKLKYKVCNYVEVIPHYGLALGTIHTFANAGCMLRAGYNLPEDYGPLMMEPVNRELFNWHVYTFISTDGRYVARNFFLDGNLFKDSHSVDKEDFVGDLTLGAVVGIKSFEITYAYNIRSKEHKTQDEHNEFGSLIFSWEY